jgi:hypothetical protein
MGISVFLCPKIVRLANLKNIESLHKPYLIKISFLHYFSILELS